MFKAEIIIMPLKELLDPQGKAVEQGLRNLSFSNISDVRVGKHITMLIDAPTQHEASEQVETACRKLLANPVIESYEYHLHKID